MTNTKTVLFIQSALLLVWLNYTTVVSLSSQVEAAVVMNKKCIDKERHALLDFKALILNDALSTWGTKEDDCCKWRGVICNNQTGHVTRLHLFNRTRVYFSAFKGTIPMSIGSLTKLRHLDLSLNSFSGTIPTSIGSLKELTDLDLSANSFSGTIPTSIGSLKELTDLDLSANYFSGTIPTSIGSLTKLRHLDLSLNSFSGTIPTSIGLLTKLRHLDLSFNSFNETIPTSIGSLNELRHLHLDYNSFSGTIPTSIGSLTKLRHLELSDNSFNGTIPTSIGSLTELRVLSLNLQKMGRCRVENLDWLSNLSHLETLGMDGVSLAKANYWVNIITSLQNLTSLSLWGCNLSQVMHPYSSSSVNSYSSSTSYIDDINIGNNNLNYSSISHWLFPLTSNRLYFLDLSDNTLDRIPKFLGNLCSLTELYLNGNSVSINFLYFLNNLSGCTADNLRHLEASSSQFTGSLSDEVHIFSSLEYLSLDHNQLTGYISEKLWELPNLYFLDVSSNSQSAFSVNFGKSKISYMNFSNNSLQWVTSKPQKAKSNFSYVEFIDLSSCKIGPRFPKWISTLKNLTHLNVASNGISDTISADFWDIWHSRLQYLNLSSNNITGNFPDLLSNFDSLHVIDLSSNNFYGLVTNVVSTSVSLDLSRNKFHGGISFLCQIVNGTLTHLDLSNNSFSGQLPDCLWHFQNLKVLNLGYNNLSGRLPSSVTYLSALEVLYLYNNKFSGVLPLSLGNCTELTFLDLGNNKFSGYVPIWIGKISGLYALSLSSNDFFGPIPLQLCQLVSLQILDLSMNNLNGTIPSCINNLTAMVREGLLTTLNIHLYQGNDFEGKYVSYSGVFDYVDHAMIQWQGNKREFSSNLRLLKSIDLSSNSLTGRIPYELIDLHGLRALNLSKNGLVGEIPQNIGQMKELQILDLSRNNLSGGLPSNMSQMNFLSYIDLSYNNLSGRIPSSTQLQSFEPSRYIGNAGLCGPPLTDHCIGDRELQVSQPIGESYDDEGDNDELQRLFYIGGSIGFAIGFWIVCSALLVNRHGRHTFFHFLDSLENMVLVKVMVFIAKFQRAAHT